MPMCPGARFGDHSRSIHEARSGGHVPRRPGPTPCSAPGSVSSAHEGRSAGTTGTRPGARCGMSTTPEQRLAQAEAHGPALAPKLEAMAGSDAPDEKFCIVHRYCEPPSTPSSCCVREGRRHPRPSAPERRTGARVRSARGGRTLERRAAGTRHPTSPSWGTTRSMCTTRSVTASRPTMSATLR